MAEETTLTVRPARHGSEPDAALLLEDAPDEAPAEPRDWFRGAIPDGARSPWKGTRTKIGMD